MKKQIIFNHYWIILIFLNLSSYTTGFTQNVSSVFLKEREIILQENSEILISSIKDVDVDSKENIWIIDWDGGQLVKYDKYGKNSLLIAKKGKGPGELYRPESIFIDNSDHVYVANILDRISMFDGNGKFINAFVPTDGHRPTTCIAAFKAKIILGGRNIGLGKNDATMIHLYSKNGEYIKSFFKMDERFITKNLSLYRAAFFDVDENGIICAVQPVNYKISVFDINGNLIKSFGRKPRYYKTPQKLTDKIEYNKKLFDNWKKSFTYVRDIFIDKNKVIVCSQNYIGNGLYRYFIDIYDLKSGALILSGIKSNDPLKRVKNGNYYFTKIIEGRTEGEFKNAIDVYTLK